MTIQDTAKKGLENLDAKRNSPFGKKVHEVLEGVAPGLIAMDDAVMNNLVRKPLETIAKSGTPVGEMRMDAKPRDWVDSIGPRTGRVIE